MKVRASFAPIAIRCAGAIHLTNTEDLPQTAPDKPAEEGTEAHDLIGAYIRGETNDLTGVPKEVSIHYHTAVKVWDYIRDYLGANVHVEQPIQWRLSGETAEAIVSGTPDVIGWDETKKWLYVIDWKTGRVERDHIPQLAVYAAIACKHYGFRADKIFLWQVNLRAEEVLPPVSRTPDEIEAVLDRLAEMILTAEKMNRAELRKYTTGGHCEYCPAAGHCPAIQSQMRPWLNALDMIADEDLEAVANKAASASPASIEYAMDMIKMAEKLGGLFRSALRTRLLATDETIVLPSGREITINTVAKKELEPTRTYAKLTENNDHEDVIACARFSTTAIESLVKRDAPRGQKGAVVRQTWDDLVECGALTEREEKRMEIRASASKKKEIE